jgi:deoxycytidylate deaminase
MSRWDNYFMDIAKRSADMSYCERMKVGAVAVRNRRPICTG